MTVKLKVVPSPQREALAQAIALATAARRAVTKAHEARTRAESMVATTEAKISEAAVDIARRPASSPNPPPPESPRRRHPRHATPAFVKPTPATRSRPPRPHSRPANRPWHPATTICRRRKIRSPKRLMMLSAPRPHTVF
jgi:hypothetical protein